MVEKDNKPVMLQDFMEVVRIRRSIRKYADTPIEAEKIDYLVDVARRGIEAFGYKSPTIIFVQNPVVKKKLARAIFSGWFGKINPWVLTTRAHGFIVACGRPDKAPVLGDRYYYLAETAVIMELVVLAAAEKGLGTCWLGGFGEEGVKEALGLDETIRVVAVSPLGYAPEKVRKTSWDYMAHNLVSKRRVAQQRIVRFMEDR